MVAPRQIPLTYTYMLDFDLLRDATAPQLAQPAAFSLTRFSGASRQFRGPMLKAAEGHGTFEITITYECPVSSCRARQFSTTPEQTWAPSQRWWLCAQYCRSADGGGIAEAVIRAARRIDCCGSVPSVPYAAAHVGNAQIPAVRRRAQRTRQALSTVQVRSDRGRNAHKCGPSGPQCVLASRSQTPRTSH